MPSSTTRQYFAMLWWDLSYAPSATQLTQVSPAFTSLDMAPKAGSEPEPDQRAIFLAACRRSGAGKAKTGSSKPSVNEGGRTAQGATNDGHSNDVRGSTDGTVGVRPKESISTLSSSAATPVTLAWTAAASGQGGLGGQNSTTQVRGENVHFQQQNYI
ncbi:hypothetical protein ColTof4_13555 [Colletotrichum tofieldiae]|nr:hypothetical protein ColTof3_14506 [Colletotrichum tofieldiae]GKT81132.1 hypothetical protein ColTof4_13555 [Colletotrichum tofieldiae]GKT97356.1 hypothetical protein Ct61P_15206 [Colletotrichum tofieldiae]